MRALIVALSTACAAGRRGADGRGAGSARHAAGTGLRSERSGRAGRHRRDRQCGHRGDDLDHVECRRQLSRALPESRNVSRDGHARRLQQVREPEGRAARRRRPDGRRRPPGRRGQGHGHGQRQRRRRGHDERRARTGGRRAEDLGAADPRGHGGRARDPGARRAEHDRPPVPQGGVQQRAVAVGQRRRRREAQRLHDRRRRQRRGGPRGLQPAVRGGRGVQDPDGDLRCGRRQRDGRLRQPGDQERHEHPPRPGLRVVSRRGAGRQQLLRQEGRPAEARLQGQPIRRGRRRPDRPQPDVLFRQRRGEPVPGAVARDPDRADREDAQRRLLGTARARFRSTRFTTPRRRGRIRPRPAASSAIRSRATSFRRTGSARSPGTSSASTRCPIRRARPTAPTTTTTRRRSPSRPTTPPRRASTTTSPTGTASTAASAGTSGKRRRTTASTTSRPASS